MPRRLRVDDVDGRLGLLEHWLGHVGLADAIPDPALESASGCATFRTNSRATSTADSGLDNIGQQLSGLLNPGTGP